MTAYQLFRGLTGVDGELLAAAELVDSRKEPAPKKLPARKIWLVAAVIALALLLAGCGIAYVLSLRQLELGTQTIPLPAETSQDGTAPTETEVQLAVFSLQGIEGTPNYQANQEWRIRSGWRSPRAIPPPAANIGTATRLTGRTAFRIRRWWTSWTRSAPNTG